MPIDPDAFDPGFRQAGSDASDPGAEQKRRARWRLLGALAFSMVVASAAFQLLLQEPRPLAQDFVVLMPISPPAASAEKAPGLQDSTEAEASAGEGVSSASSAMANISPEAGASQSGYLAPSMSTGSVKAASPEPPQRSASGPGPGGSKAWFVQLGAYESREAANTMAVKVRSLGYGASVQQFSSGQGTRFRVRVGPFNESQAKAYMERARSQGYAPFLIRP